MAIPRGGHLRGNACDPHSRAIRRATQTLLRDAIGPFERIGHSLPSHVCACMLIHTHALASGIDFRRIITRAAPLS